MKKSFFDAIVLGADLAALTTGALLAKRGFRVLLLGQHTPPPAYELGPYKLPRRPFTWSAARSPVAHRVIAELGLGPSIRRLTRPLDPAYQIALPGHRLDIPVDEADLEREIEREFAEVKRPVLDYFRHLRAQAEATDRLLERDIALPPQKFLERRELTRAAAGLAFDREGDARDPLAELPEHHAFRAAALAPACFGTALEPTRLTALQLCRLQAGFALGAMEIQGGLVALHELLDGRIRSCSGELRRDESASEILVQRSAVTGVRIHGTDEVIGTHVVIASVDVSALQPLLHDRRPMLELFERSGEPQPRHYRYTLNAILGPDAIPEGMARDVYCVRSAQRPLAGDNLLHVEVTRAPTHASLCVETLVPARAVEDRDGLLDGARERLLSAVGELMPFVREHLRLIDSPHDGRAPQTFDGTTVTPALNDRRGPQTMPCVHAFPVTSAMSLCAMPVRTELGGLLLCGPQVAPGLGLEGELLAATAAARVVCRADRAKPWMRRRLWPKVEM